jgi:RNA recognition motif-containing protein
MCDKYGKVVECRLAIDRDSNRPKGFAFVTMESADDAEKCVEGLSGKEIDGRPVTVQISHGKGGRRREGDSGDLDDARATGACFDFIRGQCSRGDSCRFKHPGGGGGRDRGDRDRGYGR